MVTDRIGKNVRRYRLMKHLTQEQLGYRVGISRRHVQRIESGDCKPGRDTLISIGIVLHLKPGDLIGL